MIYFLVNNDYQLVDARRHLAELRARGLVATLIEIPHTLNAERRGEGFERVVTLPTPLRGQRWVKAWRGCFGAPSRIAAALQPTAADVLFFYTEYELLNHMAALRFKAAGARIFLLEDGGFATYVPFSVAAEEAMTLKERIIAAMTRRLPGLRGTRFHKINGQVYPWLPDRVIDAVGVYRAITPIRDLKIRLLRRQARPAVAPHKGRVIFLNQPMYDHYQTDDQYLAGLDRLVGALCKGFHEVLFKFHPRESPAWRERIGALLAQRHLRVRILEDDRPFEQLATAYVPEALASYFSTALLNLDVTGIEPLYLYHLLPEVAEQPVFAQATLLLQRWGYRFAPSIDDVRSGFSSGLEDEGEAGRESVADIAMQVG